MKRYKTFKIELLVKKIKNLVTLKSLVLEATQNTYQRGQPQPKVITLITKDGRALTSRLFLYLNKWYLIY